MLCWLLQPRKRAGWPPFMCELVTGLIPCLSQTGGRHYTPGGGYVDDCGWPGRSRLAALSPVLPQLSHVQRVLQGVSQQVKG